MYYNRHVIYHKISSLQNWRNLITNFCMFITLYVRAHWLHKCIDSIFLYRVFIFCLLKLYVDNCCDCWMFTCQMIFSSSNELIIGLYIIWDCTISWIFFGINSEMLSCWVNRKAKDKHIHEENLYNKTKYFII